MLRAVSTNTSSSSLPFTTTAEIYDQHGESSCRIPAVSSWTSYGGISSFSGIAVTIDCRDHPADNSMVRQVLEQTASGEGKVLVIDAGGASSANHRYAFLGDQLAMLAQQKGWNGIVVHGCVRDAAQLRDLPIGIVAVGTTPRKTVKAGRGKIDVRVRIADADCYPGDYVFCDLDGVIFMNPPNVFKGFCVILSCAPAVQCLGPHGYEQRQIQLLYSKEQVIPAMEEGMHRGKL